MHRSTVLQSEWPPLPCGGRTGRPCQPAGCHRLCVRNSAETPMMDTDSPSFSSKSAHSLQAAHVRRAGSSAGLGADGIHPLEPSRVHLPAGHASPCCPPACWLEAHGAQAANSAAVAIAHWVAWPQQLSCCACCARSNRLHTFAMLHSLPQIFPDQGSPLAQVCLKGLPALAPDDEHIWLVGNRLQPPALKAHDGHKLRVGLRVAS